MIGNDTLFLIPARGGSKGLPGKNIRLFAGKPLICYSIDAARGLTSDENICVSTDDLEIAQIVMEYGLKIHFLRPPELASDSAGTRNVILHALDYFKRQKKDFTRICLLQPTSPLRNTADLLRAFALWDNLVDMVVSVKESKSNPYFNLFEENNDGFLQLSKTANYLRRQDAPKVWEYNGAIYIIRTSSIIKLHISQFKRVLKFPMSYEKSIDIDTIFDFKMAEEIYLAEKKQDLI